MFGIKLETEISKIIELSVHKNHNEYFADLSEPDKVASCT